jgi:hypothetical protein
MKRKHKLFVIVIEREEKNCTEQERLKLDGKREQYFSSRHGLKIALMQPDIYVC